MFVFYTSVTYLTTCLFQVGFTSWILMFSPTHSYVILGDVRFIFLYDMFALLAPQLLYYHKPLSPEGINKHQSSLCILTSLCAATVCADVAVQERQRFPVRYQ